MLILTRKPNEKIMIGNDIEVTVLSVHGNQCRIGVKAPPEMPVHRQEVAEKIAAQNGGVVAVGQRQHRAG